MSTLMWSDRAARRGAFTLLESLLVITIVMVLLALAVSAVRSFREDLHLARAGQLLVDEIGAARQHASAHNWTVYVYLYKVPAATPAGYCAIQLWRCAPPATGGSATAMLPIDQPLFLPAAVVISEDATQLSPLLGNSSAQTSQPPALANLSPALAGATYVAFAIQPSGMLALDGETNPPAAGAAGAPPTAASLLAASCLTLVPARFAGQTTSPPNFVTIQINPYTGTSLVYRP